MDDKFYSINEFADRIGVSQSTLRNWDKTGFLSPHHKTAGKHRMYSEEQAVKYLESNPDTRNISIKIKNGHICSVIGTDSLSDEQISELQTFLGNLI